MFSIEGVIDPKLWNDIHLVCDGLVTADCVDNYVFQLIHLQTSYKSYADVWSSLNAKVLLNGPVMRPLKAGNLYLTQVKLRISRLKYRIATLCVHYRSTDTNI